MFIQTVMVVVAIMLGKEQNPIAVTDNAGGMS